MFPLCYAFANTLNQGNCTHSDEERCKVGTWVVNEVHKTVDKGYGLVDVFEFWEYEVTCYNKDTNSVGLFAEYVNMYLNLKQGSLAIHPGFRVRKIRTNTSRTTGTQRELL